MSDEKLRGVGDEAVGHMRRLEAAAKAGEALILKQTIEVVTGGAELAAGSLYGMSSGMWIANHQRRRLIIEWDEVPSHDDS